MQIIKNVKIINPNKIIECANILIQNNKIKDIIITNNKPEFIVVPGFIDTHIHGFYNYDIMQGQKAVEIISRKLALKGTTAFMPTLMTNKWEVILDALKNVSKNKKWVSRNLGLHLEGPFIGPSKKGAHKPEYLKKASLKDINTLYQASQQKLIKVSFDPLMVGLKEFLHMKKLGIIGSIGHSNVDMHLANKYFENGCFSVCHAWNAMSGIDSRNPGLLQASLMNQNVYLEIIFDLLHISKESLTFTFINKGYDKIIAISDAIKPAYYKNGENISGDIAVVKKGLKITLKDSKTIAGSGICIHDAFKNLIKIGVHPCDVVKMTSYNSAKYLNLDNQLGKIQKNYLADLVLMDTKYRIKHVYINGQKIK
ncbi:N-acetylglucosamine 6-phosphate deacetylase [Mycoplasmopsis mustelae]|uniref:N-acetylglucosamine 6-phosphate deacetylase n=1 Tax=Mycoplasmopsis mustelae TaxID=171289 RepID=A0A4R7UDW6_9BACT|nr:N-acetylglucosamine-6-phosphate deacetylase [Mycoplasmopsis mustelae]TDV22703.1 N-acetylglucosamine 6-phosphate deacetylase [Mycoplasmopsis mustelae]